MYGACARNCNPQLYPIAYDGCQKFEPLPTNRKLCAVCRCHSNFHLFANNLTGRFSVHEAVQGCLMPGCEIPQVSHGYCSQHLLPTTLNFPPLNNIEPSTTPSQIGNIPEEEDPFFDEIKQSPILQLFSSVYHPPSLSHKSMSDRIQKRSSVLRGVKENSGLDIQGMLAAGASHEQFDLAVKKALEDRDPRRKEETLASGLRDMFRSLKKFHLLLQASGTINEDVQLHNVMERILRVSESLVDSEWASIFFVNEKSKLLVRFEPSSLDSDTVLSGGVPMNKGIVGYVASTGKCVRTTDAHADKRYDQEVDDPKNLTGAGSSSAKTTASLSFPCSPVPLSASSSAPVSGTNNTRTKCSMLCVPVVENSNPEKVTAVIQMVNSGNTQMGFTFEEEDILTFVGQLAGQTLSHATLHAQLIQFSKEQMTMHRQKSALIKVIDLMCAGVGLSSVINRIIEAAYQLVPTERVSFFMVDSTAGDLRCVISKDPEMHNIRFPIGKGIVGHVARTGVLVNIEKAANDERFDSTADKFSGFTTRSILTVPILDHNHKTHAVIQCVNKRSKSCFDENDEMLMISLAHSAAEILHKAELYEALVFEQRKSSALLRIVKANENDDGFELLIERICDITYEILECERCSLCLIDSLSGDVYLEVSMDTPHLPPVPAPFCAYIAKTGKGLLIPDISKNETFRSIFQSSSAMNKSPSTKAAIRGIIAWPIKDVLGKTVAVFQCMNKISRRAEANPTFSEEDSKILETIAAQISTLLRGHMTELLLERHANDFHTQSMLLDYGREPRYRADLRDGQIHIAARLSGDKSFRFRSIRGPFSTLSLGNTTIDVTKLAELGSLDFCCWDYSQDQLVEYAIIMFRDMGMKDWGIGGDVLRDFMLRVRSGYRDVPYHSWYHAFATIQFVYYTMTKTKLVHYLQDIDCLGLLLAAVVHDIDHPGNTNRFEQETESHLALKYNDSSVLENHHAYTFFQILREIDLFKNSKFQQPSQRKYLRALIIKAILATDMIHHFPMVKELATTEAKCSSDDPKKVLEHRQFLVSSVIHSADISAQCYPFKTAAIWESKVTNEFMVQAQRENELGIEVQPHMRDLQNNTVRFKAHLGFLDYVMSPLWNNMQKIFPELSECVINIVSNREQYARLAGFEEEEKKSQSPHPSRATTHIITTSPPSPKHGPSNCPSSPPPTPSHSHPPPPPPPSPSAANGHPVSPSSPAPLLVALPRAESLKF